ncbi:MAG: hypothetical protein ACOY3D_03815 [Candidatus Omnitrophota bacterium]
MFYFVNLLINFKKHLGQEKAQTAVEYFVIFAVVAAVTLLSVAAFYNRLHQASEVFFNKSAEAIMGEPVEDDDVSFPLPGG